MSGRVWSIVLAGGRGRRLEAITAQFEGEALPKQYCAFGRRRTLLQRTVQRSMAVAPPERTLVVVQESHADRARRQLEEYPGIRIVAQPCDRGTAAGILLPLTEVLREDPHALVLLLPSDHAVGDERRFVIGIQHARRAITHEAARVVLFGVRGDSPREDYGWIRSGEPLGFGLHRVESFLEKPPQSVARQLFLAGELWNTMILLARGAALRALFLQRQPSLSAALAEFGALPHDQRARALQTRYGTLPDCDFSREVLQGSEDLALYAWPETLGWMDLGTPERLAQWLAAEAGPAREQVHAP